MLSYRHAFHAGNHADLLKHLVFSLVLDYYNRKDKPYICIDTHAGAGYYDLDSDYARKTGEQQEGIALLRAAKQQDACPEILAQFLTTIDVACNWQKQYYPGSPAIAASLMRKQDYLRLCELHPTDTRLLELNMQHIAGNVRYSIEQRDGLKAALSWLPPPNRRAVVLTDPAYEVKSDYSAIPDAFSAMHKRCREACLILWYPLLERSEVGALRDTLQKQYTGNHLLAELQVHAPAALGMYGSGMFVINPPYVLAEQLEQALPPLTGLLAQDDTATHRLMAS